MAAIATISFDDIDSPEGGCTTHLAGLFLLQLSREGVAEPLDFPLLVRLNPGVPWKTRGNAAVALRLLVRGDAAEIYEAAVSMADEYTRGRRPLAGKSYGVALALGPAWLDERLRWLYRKALTDIVTLDVALDVAESAGVRVAGGRGVVGALAALAALDPGRDDYTFELAAYRQPQYWGEDRCVAEGPELARVEASLPACVFNNSYAGRLVAAPRGPDPVLAGFRGDCPQYLHAYASLLCEKPHFWVLYRSNQHTDAHGLEMDSIYPYRTGRIRGVVAGAPEKIAGGHVVVRASTRLGDVDLAFFRETGPLREAAELLRPGDRIAVQGTVRPYAPRGRPTIAVDKMIVEGLAEAVELRAPRCPRCGRRMKSLGRGKGYVCPHCGYRDPHAAPLKLRAPRRLAPGVYTPPPGLLRHLTAPPGRRGQDAPPPRPSSWDEVVSAGGSPPRPPGFQWSPLSWD